eukprot:357845-Chlamydomonas_euryale.AAC.5
MLNEEGRLFGAACAADPLTGQTWPHAAAWEPPKGWPQSAPACVDARMHACMHACTCNHPFRIPGCPGRVPFSHITRDARVQPRMIR